MAKDDSVTRRDVLGAAGAVTAASLAANAVQGAEPQGQEKKKEIGKGHGQAGHGGVPQDLIQLAKKMIRDAQRDARANVTSTRTVYFRIEITSPDLARKFIVKSRKGTLSEDGDPWVADPDGEDSNCHCD